MCYSCSQWNPNPDHHLLAVGAGKYIVLVATGTGGEDATALTEALLQASCPSNGNGNGSSSGGGVDSVDGEEDDKEDDEVGPSAEVADQSDEDGDGEEMLAGKKAPPVKWKALTVKKKKLALQDAIDKRGAGARVSLM